MVELKIKSKTDILAGSKNLPRKKIVLTKKKAKVKADLISINLYNKPTTCSHQLLYPLPSSALKILSFLVEAEKWCLLHLYHILYNFTSYILYNYYPYNNKN